MSSQTLDLLNDFPPVSYEQWRQVVDKDLKGAPFEKKLISRTFEGIEVQPLYTQQDWPADGDPSGFPGFDPTTRGISPLATALHGWDVRQEHADPDAARSNKLILEDLAGGVTSLQLRLDAASRFGMDSDDPAASELAGRDGLMLDHVDDWDALLDGVHLDIAGIGLEAGAGVTAAAAQLVALLRRRGVALHEAKGALNADPLAVLARRGEYPCPIDDALRLTGDLAVWTDHNLPGFTAVRVGSAPYHHAGATAAQDLAFSMATAVTYLRAMTDAGLSAEAASAQLLFSYGVGTNLFLAVAKLRAARRLWSHIAGHCGIDADRAATGLKMHVRPSKRVLTQRDPYVNMLRDTVCCFAAAIGGAQVITCEPFDKAIGLPDAFSRRIARNTHAILAEESHAGRVVDPAGGSWMVESLTDDLCETAWPIFQEIESRGGMPVALQSGWISSQIESAFGKRLDRISSRRDAVTGVSEFPNLGEAPVERRTADVDSLLQQAAKRLKGQHRDAATRDVTGELDALASAIGDPTDDPGMVTAHAVAAAEAGATVGQLCGAIFRDMDPIAQAPISPHPYAEPFEELRDASDHFAQLTGQRPRIALINLGPVAQHTARNAYSRNLFEAGGIEAVSSDALTGDPDAMAEAAVGAFAASEARVACICSSDKLYADAAGPVAAALKRAGAEQVILAGAPGDQEQAYREAGVDRFIFMKCNVLQTLRDLMARLGVIHTD
jgi:methylmalonyl-CoA mutase